MASNWVSYNDLAWTEDWLADPAVYEDEVKVYVDLIRSTASKSPSTLLHLGSGAGGHDTIFKRHFCGTKSMIGKGTRLQVDRWLTMVCNRRCSAALRNAAESTTLD